MSEQSLMWAAFGVLMVVMLAIDLGMFVYLKLGISSIMGFVGGKMIATAMGVHIPIQISLLVIFTCLTLAVTASLLVGRKAAVPVEHV